MRMTMNRLRSITLLVGAVALASCDKNTIQDITAPAPESGVRFFNFSVGAPGVNFFANDTKISAILSATGSESTTGLAYGGASAGGAYWGLHSGQYTLAGKIAATTDHNLTVASVNANIESGKHYSIYMAGFYNSTAKTVETFMIEDPIPAQIDYTVTNVRFVNTIGNSSPMTLYAKNTVTGAEVAVGGLTAYKSAGAFVPLPPGIYDLSTRTAGSSTNAIARTAVGFGGGHFFTITARGDITITSTTATNRPQLDNTFNR
jgi:Domain of unknown function (DUF4397)